MVFFYLLLLFSFTEQSFAKHERLVTIKKGGERERESNPLFVSMRQMIGGLSEP